MNGPGPDGTQVVRVGFNQQQRQLLERLKESGQAGKTDGEIIRFGFARWLESQGWFAETPPPGKAGR